MNYLGLWKHWDVLLFPSIFLTGALGCATRKYMYTFCAKLIFVPKVRQILQL